MDNSDFGFSLVGEEEIKKYETQLQSEVDTHKQTALEKDEQIRELQKRIKNIMLAITPLLKSLQASPEKSYIWWPNRSAKIEEFAKQIAKIAYPQE